MHCGCGAHPRLRAGSKEKRPPKESSVPVTRSTSKRAKMLVPRSLHNSVGHQEQVQYVVMTGVIGEAKEKEEEAYETSVQFSRNQANSSARADLKLALRNMSRERIESKLDSASAFIFFTRFDRENASDDLICMLRKANKVIHPKEDKRL